MTKDAIDAGVRRTLRPGAELAPLEAAARSRSEADWLVGMNATRAATIRAARLFDGAVSLGRVQTPTLAILARREKEIQRFEPSPTGSSTRRFQPGRRAQRVYAGRYHVRGSRRRDIADRREDADGDRRARPRGAAGAITCSRSATQREQPPLLYDLTALQREANTRLRLLGAAHARGRAAAVTSSTRCSPTRAPSRYLLERHDPRAQADRRPRRRAPAGVRAGRRLRAGPARAAARRASSTTRRSPTTTRSSRRTRRRPASSSCRRDEQRIYDMAARRFLAVFHPRGRVREHDACRPRSPSESFRSRGKVMLEAGLARRLRRGAADEQRRRAPRSTRTRAPTSSSRRWTRASRCSARRSTPTRKETKPPPRYGEAALLGAMEGAGKLVEDDELREAMKDSGIGTPATRASIIERLIDVGYVVRDGRRLRRPGRASRSSTCSASTRSRARADRRLGAPPARHRARRRRREAFMSDIAKFTEQTVATCATAARGVRFQRRDLDTCPRCGEGHRSRTARASAAGRGRGAGLRLRDLEVHRRQAAARGGRPRADPPGCTAQPVTGFRGRSGRSFRARLALQQNEEGKWRVEFDEPWAREGAKPPEAEADAGAAEAGQGATVARSAA